MDEVPFDHVGRVLREAARTAVLPLFQRLADTDVEEKAPGEVVTVADREAEKLITAGLLDAAPGSTVVGEEAVHADPALLDRLRDAGPVWLVDPVDGTANFAAGRRPFVMMVALLCDGVTRAAWIHDPIEDTMLTAARGAGAHLDGKRLRAPVAGPGAPLRGVVSAKYLPGELRTQVPRRAATLGEVLPGQHCAGYEYPAVVSGEQDYAMFWRTLPWDHAAGALIIEEAGGVVRRLDGAPYDPTVTGPRGLLVAASEAVWQRVRTTLFP